MQGSTRRTTRDGSESEREVADIMWPLAGSATATLTGSPTAPTTSAIYTSASGPTGLAPGDVVPGGGGGTTAAATTTATTTTTAAASGALLPAAAFLQMNFSHYNNESQRLNLNLHLHLGEGGGEAHTNNSSVEASASTAIDSLPAVDSMLADMAWPKVLIVSVFLLLILVTVVGNTLVILAVLTTRRLRTVTNCFVMNLAITDWLVGTCVMPPAVIRYVVGSWRFGWILCDIWISLDVLLCTGSILSLCAISLDRYLAVTQPLTYSKKRRSKRLALFMIFVVWVTALSITCPPYLGWYEPERVVCRYNQNKGYVVFSAMGSFFIPLAVMLYVYLKIGYVLTSRRQRIVRDANSERTADLDHDIDCDNFLSESEHFQCATPKFPSFKSRWGSGRTSNGHAPKQGSLRCARCDQVRTCVEPAGPGPGPGLPHQASFYELVEISRLSSLLHCSAVGCRYGAPCLEARASTMPLPLHYADSRSSFSETCLAAKYQVDPQSTASHPLPPHHPGHHQHHHHQHHHHQQHQHHHHHPHRVAMRVSTTKRDTKTAKTLTIVMGGFIACWLPFFIYYILIPFLPPAAVLEWLMSVLTWVGWVNCGINPFIYAFYNPDFRTAFWRLTCRRICKQKPPTHHLAMYRG